MKQFSFKILARKLRKSKVSKRLLGLRGIPLVVTVGASIMLVGGGVFAAHATIFNNENSSTSGADTLGAQNTNAQHSLHHASTVPASNDEHSNTHKSSDSQTNDNSQVIKYKTDSDPRSTAYSLTPPKPSPKNFDIAITHNGQVAVGTLISYNADKNGGIKTYYGGDYIFTPTTITVDKKKSVYSNQVTIYTPDGAEANEPTPPWNANPVAYPFVVAPDASAKSWTMQFSISPSQPDGTYQIHLTSFRTGGSEPAWEYDGFLTLVVEN
jgi:cytoskeletal protein RodZ